MNAPDRGRMGRRLASETRKPDRDLAHSMWDAMAASLAVTAQAGELAFRTFADALAQGADTDPGPEPLWATPHRIVTETASFRVRDFSTGRGTPPVLIVAPFALHGATVADFAPGHSLVERLLAEGLEHVLLVEWTSTTAATRCLTIDNYLADLNAVIDDCGGRVTLIGLCQGGWLSLMAAARFPQKVDRLVLAGSPVDLDAAPSKFVEAVRAVSPATFESLVRAGNGIIVGKRMLSAWGAGSLDAAGQAHTLQLDHLSEELSERFQKWDRWAVNLPGAYYLQTVEQLFRGNQLARSAFRALGRVLDLSKVDTPTYLLAGEHDEVTPPEQVLALRRLLGTSPDRIRSAVAPSCAHLSLFMGARTLATAWPAVCAWIRDGFVAAAPQPQHRIEREHAS